MPRRNEKLEFRPPASLTALMVRQSGTFTSEQARKSGISGDEIQDLRGAGALMSLRRGVYVEKEAFDVLDEDRKHLTRAAAVRHVLGDVVFSHQTAALAAGLELWTPDLSYVHVTRPHLKSSRREAGIDHHSGALGDGHVMIGDVGTYTSLARTAFDVASMTPFEQGLAAVDSALRLGATEHELLNVLEFCRPWTGSRVASRASCW